MYDGPAPARPLLWLGSARDDLRGFPVDARLEAGKQLRRVQRGLLPTDWKPVPAIGPGAREIRIHSGLECRVIYVARFTEGVFVLHAFEKRTRKTPRSDIELARRRLRDLTRPRPLR